MDCGGKKGKERKRGEKKGFLGGFKKLLFWPDFYKASMVAKDISLSSAGIDAMTHWAATVPAETQKKPVCPAQKKGKREAER